MNGRKIFYSIHHVYNHTKETLDFIVKAISDTFFMIKYQLVNYQNKDKNIIESGVNYIISKNIEDEIV